MATKVRRSEITVRKTKTKAGCGIREASQREGGRGGWFLGGGDGELLYGKGIKMVGVRIRN